LNKAALYERTPDQGTRMLHVPAASPRSKSPRYAFDVSTGGLQAVL